MLRHAALRSHWPGAARRLAGRPSGICSTPGRKSSIAATPGDAHRRAGRGLAAAAAANPAAPSPPPSSPAPPPPLPATPWRLYDHPSLYDALFGFRDFRAEVAFVADALARHGSPPGAPLTCFLDAGCGPAHHARAAAARPGVTSSLALDASPAMLAYAASEAEREGVTILPLRADLAEAGACAAALARSPPSDAALAALGTLAHAAAPGAPASAFQSLAAALRPGGILVLELAAADDVFDGSLIGGDAWDVVVERAVVEAAAGPGAGPPPPEAPPPPSPRPGGFGGGASASKAGGSEGAAPEATARPARPAARLVVEYGSPDDPWDAAAQVLTRTVRITEALPGGKAGKGGGGGGGGGSRKKGGGGGGAPPPPPARLIGQEAVPQRVFTPQEIALLGAGAGLELVGQYGDMSLGVPPVGAGGDRWVGVLVKKA